MNLCKICKEPIWNFICIDCLAGDIKKWIPGNLTEEFSAFHRSLSAHFYSKTDRFMSCLKCRVSSAPHICIPCYLNEIHSWFKSHRIAGRIREMISLDFEGLEKNLKEHSALPITEIKNHRERFGVCDECGEYSESLTLINWEWVCEDCRNLMEG